MVIPFAIQEKSLFIPVLSCTLCIMWQCTQNNDWVTVLLLLGFVIVIIQLSYVLMPLLNGNLHVRIVNESGVLSLLLCHRKIIGNVLPITAKKLFFAENNEFSDCKWCYGRQSV